MTRPRQPLFRFWVGWLCLLGVVFSPLGAISAKAGSSKTDVGTFCFAAGTLVATETGGVPIDSLRLGDRVIAQPGGGSAPSAVEAGQWLEVELSFADPTGSGEVCHARLLRSREYVEGRAWTEGDWVEVSLGDEIDSDGVARVDKIRPSAGPGSGRGHVVLGTFQTWHRDLCELSVEGMSDPVRVTAGHRFHLMDRGWVPVDQLHPGDRIDSLDGTGRSVTAVRALPGLQAVYNLEIESLHQYHVSAAGLLSHNNSDCGPSKSGNALQDSLDGGGGAAKKPPPNSKGGIGNPALSDDPYSPQSVSRRQSETRRQMGLEPDPNSPIPNQPPGENIKGTHSADTAEHHGTGERNVGTVEEHSRVAKGSNGMPRGRP